MEVSVGSDLLRHMKSGTPRDKKKRLREVDHLTRPPRLEGKAKNAGMNPVHKPKKTARKNREEKKESRMFEDRADAGRQLAKRLTP